jgi:hypothetical protein
LTRIGAYVTQEGVSLGLFSIFVKEER